MKDKMTLDTLAGIVKNSFVDMERQTDKRFEKVDQHLDRLESTMNHRFDEMVGRLTSVERRTTVLEEK